MITKSISRLLFILIFPFLAFSQPGTTCWRHISAGYNFSLAIKTDGTLWGWGLNSNQLGLGFSGNQNAPIQIGTANDWVAVSAGYNHSLALKNNGTLWTWGDGQFGALGNATFNSATWNVTQVGTANDWSQISAGKLFSLAIKTNGTLWSWGRNNTGQLGISSLVDQNIPTQIGTATDWMLIDAGDEHSLAIKTNNSMWAWGNNVSGQLGDGSNTTSQVPIQITTTFNWMEISAGGGHSMALDVNNILWTWGNNVNGQLGDASNANSNLPINISFSSAGTVSAYIKISAGEGHSLAILNDNTLWSSGLNTSGQLGLGTNTNTNVLTIVGLLNTWDKISAGNQHSLAMETTSNLWSTGRNMEGQLGVGNNTASNNLVLVSCPPTSGASLEENADLYDYLIYPNPVEKLLNINLHISVGEINYQLTDAQGKIVQSGSNVFSNENKTMQIDFSSHEKGIYFLNIENGNRVETKKVIKL